MQAAFPARIRIATRASRLAVWQAEHVAGHLRRRFPQSAISLCPIKTKGDIFLTTPLTRIGGKGLFTKELETALYQETAELAVHSMKDLGAYLPDGFVLAAILQREDPRDAFVSNLYSDLNELPRYARVGTSSLRRRMQIAYCRPDIELLDLRGNVETRLHKLDQGQFDAIILAAAGLIRLKLEKRIRQFLPPEISLPAIGQGAIGIECRADSPLLPLLRTFNHAHSALCVHSERTINLRLEGNCQVPIAAYATTEQKRIRLRARIGTPDGKRMLDLSDSDQCENAERLSNRVADALIAQGALEILDALRDT